MDPADFQGLDPWQALACAILARAFEDALTQARGYRDARAAGYPPGMSLADGAWHFLDGNGARLLWSLLDLDPGEFDRRLAAVPRAAHVQPLLFDPGGLTPPWRGSPPRGTPAPAGGR